MLEMLVVVSLLAIMLAVTGLAGGQETGSTAAHREVVQVKSGRQVLRAKLNRIHLNQVTFDATPLVEVLRTLNEESIKHDPDHEGVPFILKSKPDPLLQVLSDQFAPPFPFYIDEVRIRIQPPLRDMRLVDLLDGICQVAEQPITYVVENYAVVFRPKLQPPFELITRQFQANAKTFAQALQAFSATNVSQKSQNADGEADVAPGAFKRIPILSAGGKGPDLHGMFREYLALSGVNLDPPKSFFFNDRAGSILIRATEQDFLIIEPALAMLNAPDPALAGPGRAGTSSSKNGAAHVVTITKAAPRFHLDNIPVTLEELQTGLSEQVAKDPDVKIEIRPGRDAPISEVVKAVQAAKAANVKFSPSLLVLPDKK